VFQSEAEAIAAPTSPMRPSPAIGMRSPGCRNASASIAAAAESVTMTMGMMPA
jgi:hypothetical protein